MIRAGALEGLKHDMSKSVVTEGIVPFGGRSEPILSSRNK